MQRKIATSRRGFSLVELLAVVLVLAVLSAAAVPMYINSRRSAAARTCKSNIAAIAAAESAWAARNGGYTTTINTAYTAPTGTGTASGGLVGAPEGMGSPVFCPVDGTTAYTATVDASGALTIACPNAAAHAAVAGTAADYSKTLAAPAKDAIP